MYFKLTKSNRLITKALILIVISMLTTKIVEAQNNFEIYTGAGVLELFHIGGNYELDKISLGASLGYNSDGNNDEYSIAANLNYYIGNSDRHLWFCRLGFDQLILKEPDITGSAFYVTPRIGRKFYFTEKCGLKGDIGINYSLFENNLENGETLIDLEKFIPAFSLVFFYRF